MAGARMGGALRRIHHLFAEGTAAGLADGQLLERFLAGGMSPPSGSNRRRVSPP
jgi:hypothetical protein